MKIIKYGEGYPMQICCSECNSTLEIERGDLFSNTTIVGVQQSVIKQKKVQYIICPVCGKTNIVREEIVDYAVGRK